MGCVEDGSDRLVASVVLLRVEEGLADLRGQDRGREDFGCFRRHEVSQGHDGHGAMGLQRVHDDGTCVQVLLGVIS